MANIGNGLAYVASGFRLDGSIEEGDVVWYPQDTVKINQGDAIFTNGGYATNVGTQFAATFLGVALFASDNSAAGGTQGGMSIAVIKPNSDKFFWVPVGSASVITVAAVGAAYDLKNNHSIDLTDTTNTTWLFEVVDYDASTLAVAANAAGFAKGKFQHQ